MERRGIERRGEGGGADLRKNVYKGLRGTTRETITTKSLKMRVGAHNSALE